MDATEILAAIKTGRTLYIQTRLRTTKIDARTVAKFDAAGVPVLKTGKDGHLYVAEGRRYVDAHYATVTLV